MSLPSLPFMPEKVTESIETPPPMARLNLVRRAVAIQGQSVEMLRAANTTAISTKGVAEQRYGKYISNSARLETVAVNTIINNSNPEIKTDKSKVSVVNVQELADPKTILDEEPFHDAYLFDAMAADLNMPNPSQVVAGITEQKTDGLESIDTQQTLTAMMSEARATAEDSAIGTEETYGNITKTANND